MAVPIDLIEIGYILLLLLVLGALLVVFQSPIVDGFYGGSGSALRCDVDNPCAVGLKCINGFCAKTDPVEIKEADPVPLLPGGGAAPYF